MKRSNIEMLLIIFFVAFLQWQVITILHQQSVSMALRTENLETEAFRQMKLSEVALTMLRKVPANTNLTAGDVLTVLYAAGKYMDLELLYPDYQKFISVKGLLLKYNPSGYDTFRQAYDAIWKDIRCFPVAEEGMAFENSWMFERTFGGLRGHEGTDVMPPENLRGYYRVVSMTDGIVEKIGWLPQGGFRIGIRSASGGYFYYAHLDSYGRNFRVGDKVQAGELLGRMGDTGYGEEGTMGKFEVHLHLGIYITTETKAEMSINPYWVLRYLVYAAK